MNRSILFTLILVLGTASALHAAPPQVINHLPADPAIALIIPSIEKANHSVRDFAKAVADLAGQPLSPELNDPVRTMLHRMQIMQSVRTEDGAAIVIPVLQLNAPEPNMILILPVTDYEFFLDNFKDVKDVPDSDLKTFVFAGGVPVYTRPSGDEFVMIAKDPALLTANPDAADPLKLYNATGSLGQAAFDSSAAVLLINVSKVAPQLDPLIDMGIANMMMQFSDPRIAAQMDPMAMSMLRAEMKLYGQLFHTILRDSQTLMISASPSAQGISLAYAAQFREGTFLHEVFAKAPAKATLNRLPNLPFWFAMDFDVAHLPMDKIFSALTERLNQVSIDEPALAPLLNAYVKTFDTFSAFQTNQTAGYMPEDKQSPLFGRVGYVYTCDSPQEMRTHFQQTMSDFTKTWSDLAASVHSPDSPHPSSLPDMSFDYHADAAQLNGSSVDQFTFKYSIPMMPMPEGPPTPQQKAQQMGQQMARQMIKNMMGDQLNGYVTNTDEALVMTYSPDLSLLAQTLETAGGSGKLDDNPAIIDARTSLPDHRFAEGFIDMSSIISLFAPSSPADAAAPTTPPSFIAFSASNHEGGCSFSLNIPMPTIASFMQLVAQMQAQIEAQLAPPSSPPSVGPSSM